MTDNPIMRFVAPEHDKREYLQKPWRLDDGSIVATSGTILIVCCSQYDLTGVELNDPETKVPNISRLISDYPTITDWHPLPDIKNCSACDNTGWLNPECAECDGDGVVTCNMDHEHDCRECDGAGYLAEKCQCNADADYAVPIGNRFISGVNARKIADLPGVQWGVASDDKNSNVFFRFNQGHGVIGPFRPASKEYEHAAA